MHAHLKIAFKWALHFSKLVVTRFNVAFDNTTYIHTFTHAISPFLSLYNLTYTL